MNVRAKKLSLLFCAVLAMIMAPALSAFAADSGENAQAHAPDSGMTADQLRQLEEEKEFSALLGSCYQKYDQLIFEALGKRDFEKVVSLAYACADVWQTETANWKSKWARDARRTKTAGYLMIAEDKLRMLKRFDECAQVFIRCNKLAAQDDMGEDFYSLQLVGVYIEAKEFEKAKLALQSAIASRRADESRAAIYYSYIYEQSGEEKLAETTLQDLIGSTLQKKNWTAVREAREALRMFYIKQNRREESEKVKLVLADRQCPVCKTDAQVSQIRYGLPGRPLEKNERTGGCVVTPASSIFFCNSDHTSF